MRRRVGRHLALSRALDDATLWLGGDVRPWKKLLQDERAARAGKMFVGSEEEGRRYRE